MRRLRGTICFFVFEIRKTFNADFIARIQLHMRRRQQQNCSGQFQTFRFGRQQSCSQTDAVVIRVIRQPVFELCRFIDRFVIKERMQIGRGIKVVQIRRGKGIHVADKGGIKHGIEHFSVRGDVLYISGNGDDFGNQGFVGAVFLRDVFSQVFQNSKFSGW